MNKITNDTANSAARPNGGTGTENTVVMINEPAAVLGRSRLPVDAQLPQLYAQLPDAPRGLPPFESFMERSGEPFRSLFAKFRPESANLSFIRAMNFFTACATYVGFNNAREIIEPMQILEDIRQYLSQPRVYNPQVRKSYLHYINGFFEKVIFPGVGSLRPIENPGEVAVQTFIAPVLEATVLSGFGHNAELEHVAVPSALTLRDTDAAGVNSTELVLAGKSPAGSSVSAAKANVVHDVVWPEPPIGSIENKIVTAFLNASKRFCNDEGRIKKSKDAVLAELRVPKSQVTDVLIRYGWLSQDGEAQFKLSTGERLASARKHGTQVEQPSEHAHSAPPVADGVPLLDLEAMFDFPETVRRSFVDFSKVSLDASKQNPISKSEAIALAELLLYLHGNMAHGQTLHQQTLSHPKISGGFATLMADEGFRPRLKDLGVVMGGVGWDLHPSFVRRYRENTFIDQWATIVANKYNEVRQPNKLRRRSLDRHSKFIA